MQTLENYVTKLNLLLDENELNQKQFECLTEEIIEKFNPKFSLLDFKFYNEELKQRSSKEKRKAIYKGDYELAAEKRNIERECQQHINLKMDFDVKKSMFYASNNYLYCFNLGITENDRLVNECFARLSKGQNTFVKLSKL
jgi:hypothetical protein